jgi:hypothetical protein
MEVGADLENTPARIAAQSIWGTDPISDQERIPIWLDCDTGLCNQWSESYRPAISVVYYLTKID